MKKQRTLLFVGAHPDDETFSVGGTLAKYATSGAAVYYACATRGEVGEADPVYMCGFASIGDMRWSELECAARILGLAGVIYLGYRDSGMPDTADNKHPQALAAAPLEDVAGRIIKVIRELKPEVMITFDPIGGYRHPDHIAVHNATVKAFHAAGEPEQYPETGLPFQPDKLYFTIFPRGLLRIMVKLMPLFGQDPRHFGRNKDIDLASVAKQKFPIHAAVRLVKQDVEKRNRASACHGSQSGGGRGRGGLFKLIERILGQRDYYMRDYPPPEKGRETDLFQDLN
jgi:N-acetyl-1-D-myo-inositol-2-amino-2-deoxy-alpha-D-glucopyranoside deacetylase